MPTPQVQKGILAAMKWWETELAAYKRPDDPEALQELQQHRQLIADVEAADCDDLRLEVNQLRSLLFRVQRRFEACRPHQMNGVEACRAGARLEFALPHEACRLALCVRSAGTVRGRSVRSGSRT